MKFKDLPDKNGYFGQYGGRFVPETLMKPVLELEAAYKKFKNDPKFKKDLQYYLKSFVGRPTPLYYAGNLSVMYNSSIYLKFLIIQYLSQLRLQVMNLRLFQVTVRYQQ